MSRLTGRIYIGKGEVAYLLEHMNNNNLTYVALNYAKCCVWHEITIQHLPNGPSHEIPLQDIDANNL